MENSPTKPTYDRSLQSFVLSATTLSLAIIIGYFAIVALTGWGLQNRILLTYIAVPIALLGLAYNFFVWPKIESQRPYASTYASLGFLGITIAAITLFTGAIHSPLLPAIAILLLASSILGKKGYRVTLAASLVLYAMLVVTSLIITRSFYLGLSELLYILLSAVLGWLVARSIDHYVETARLATTITNQLDSTQLSEKLMLSAIADPVVGVNKKLEVILFNSAAEEMTGWGSKDALGVQLQTIMQLLDGNEVPISKATNPFLQVFTEKDQVTTDKFHIIDKQNEKISYSISVAPTFDMQNNIDGAIAVFHNISEQKALQRQRNEFVSTASHEMRTPVAAIEGYLSMAANPNLSTVDERAKNFITKAHDSAIHLGKLFQDLLSVTKIEDQRLRDVRQVFNMTDLVSQVATETELMAKKKGLAFYTHMGSERAGNETVVAPLFSVNADPERVREVLTNLIDNAIKYTQQGSVDITLTGDRKEVKVGIKDTGVGIDPEEQKHMFEKFYRVNNSMTREVGGTGLGLYIARTLIELYGGKIWVESIPGQGSSFYFTLPLVKT